jgi:uncharacterized membrane protein YcaP (DUF421 family)
MIPVVADRPAEPSSSTLLPAASASAEEPQVDQILNLDPLALAIVVARTLVVYAALLVGLRLAGKRELGQATTFDLVVVLVIANAVQSAMVGSDVSLNGGLLAAGTLLAVNWLVGRLGLRSAWLRQRLTGSPILLVHEGTLLAENLRREGVAEDEVLQALREHGVSDLDTVKLAVLEVDGTISVIPNGTAGSRTRRRVRGRKLAG